MEGLNMRTTSSLEGVNSIIQKSFPKITTIFKFAESLRMYEATKATDLYQIGNGQITNPQLERRRKADKERDKKIKYFTAELNSGNISIADFLLSMSDKDIQPPSGTYEVLISKLNHSPTLFHLFSLQ